MAQAKDEKTASTAERKKRGSKASLEPIQEETALVPSGVEDGKQRSKKLQDLLDKVKKVTQNSKAIESKHTPLALPGT